MVKTQYFTALRKTFRINSHIFLLEGKENTKKKTFVNAFQKLPGFRLPKALSPRPTGTAPKTMPNYLRSPLKIQFIAWSHSNFLNQSNF